MNNTNVAFFVRLIQEFYIFVLVYELMNALVNKSSIQCFQYKFDLKHRRLLLFYYKNIVIVNILILPYVMHA